MFLSSCLLLCALTSPPQATPARSEPTWARQVLFKVERGVKPADVGELIAELGVLGTARPAFRRPASADVAEDRAGVARIHVLEVDAATRDDVIARFAAHERIAWAEPNLGGQGLTGGGPLFPNDAFFTSQWPLDQFNDVDMDLPEAWGLQGGFDAAPLTVAVIDSGIGTGPDHPDLGGLPWAHPGEVAGNGIDDDANGFTDDVTGYDFVNDDGTPDDENGHGIGVTSILSARADNGTDLAGVAPGVRVMVLKTFDSIGCFPASGPYAGHLSVAAALIYAADEGALLVNNSWGVFTGPSQVVTDAVNYALDRGVHLVFAAGNFNEMSFFPAELDGVISVAALDSAGIKSDWGGGLGSNYGAWVDLAAGGTAVPAYYLFPGIFGLSGTSMASPNACGVAAMALSHSPCLSQEDLRSLLMQAAVSVDAANPGFAGLLGAGHVNAYNTLKLLAPTADLGGGVAGNSEPKLNVWGGTQVGDVMTISISGGWPTASGLLFVGASSKGAPTLGGPFVPLPWAQAVFGPSSLSPSIPWTTVPSPDYMLPFTLDGDGAWRIDVPLTADIQTGVSIFLQAMLGDSGAPRGLAFTAKKSFTGQ